MYKDYAYKNYYSYIIIIILFVLKGDHLYINTIEIYFIHIIC